MLKKWAKGTMFVPLNPIPPTHLHWTRIRTDTHVDQSAASPEDLEEGPRALESALFAELSHGEWEPYAPSGIAATTRTQKKAGLQRRVGVGPWVQRGAVSDPGGSQFPVAGGRPGCAFFLRPSYPFRGCRLAAHSPNLACR